MKVAPSSKDLAKLFVKKASSRQILGAGAGLGLAALENQYVGSELPEPLKNVNYGIGGLTGMLAASPDPKVRYLALGSLPLKEMGLFGIGALDKLRKQQQSLVDANLDVARINRDTASLNQSNAGSRNALAAAFLIPALAGGGAAALWAYDKWKKKQQGIPRYKTLGEKGRDSSARSKIRIDIPTSAIPPEFYHSLSAPEESGKAHVRLQQLTTPEQEDRVYDEVMQSVPAEERAKMSAWITKYAAADNDRITAPRLIWDFAKEFTGLPSVGRAARDFGDSFANFREDNPGKATRYGLGALGNAAVGLAAMRWGLKPLLAKSLGASGLIALGAKGIPESLTAGQRLGWINRALGMRGAEAVPGFTSTLKKNKFFQLPWFATSIAKDTFRAPITHAAADTRFAYNPNAFAWEGRTPAKDVFKPSPASEQALNQGRYANPKLPTLPGTPDAMNLQYGGGGSSPIVRSLYNKFLTAPKNAPTSTLGHAFNIGRYGANRALQGAYGVKQWAGRNPNAALTAAGILPASMGTMEDERQDTEARAKLRGYMPDWAANRGHFGMPLTGTMGNIFQMIGLPDNASGIRSQISNPTQFVDPFGQFR